MHRILDFVSAHTVNVEGVGDVCDYSVFDLELYGDERYGTEKVRKLHRILIYLLRIL